MVYLPQPRPSPSRRQLEPFLYAGRQAVDCMSLRAEREALLADIAALRLSRLASPGLGPTPFAGGSVLPPRHSFAQRF